MNNLLAPDDHRDKADGVDEIRDQLLPSPIANQRAHGGYTDSRQAQGYAGRETGNRQAAPGAPQLGAGLLGGGVEDFMRGETLGVDCGFCLLRHRCWIPGARPTLVRDSGSWALRSM